MYIIINKTKNTKTKHEGNWPEKYLEQMLEAGDKVIVLSTYSNTIKVPYFVEYNGIKELKWENYSFA